MKTCPVCDTDYPDQQTNCATDGAVLIVSQELAPGSLVRGKYRIIRKLGQGGMGVVYLAEDSLLGVKVALKFLARDLGKDPRFIKRFRTEARAAYQLRHPNIAEVTNLDQAEDGSLFIAMEYIEGPSLRALLDQNPKGLAIPRALEIAKGIASGLAAAHAQGTIHRDIKPENILITRAADGTERTKVLDFGIAAVAESVTKMTRTQGFILTYAYAAPEQWNEMPAEDMDGRTDLYALGCVLYEMLTGTTPFHAHTTAGWMKQHCEESPKPPSTLRPELADWTNLDALLALLIVKDRNRRPKDAAESIRLLSAVRRVPAKKQQDTVVESPTIKEVWGDQKEAKEGLEDQKETAATKSWNPFNHRLKLYSAVAVAVLLLFVRSSLPFVAYEASLHNISQLAWASGGLFRLAGFAGQGEYASWYAQECAEKRTGGSCLALANTSYAFGGYTFDKADATALTARGIEIMRSNCFDNVNQYTGPEDCINLGEIFSGNYVDHGVGDDLRTDMRIAFPLDAQRSVNAFERACDLENEWLGCKLAGEMYMNGTVGLPKDMQKAELLFRKGCVDNQGESCSDLAHITLRSSFNPTFRHRKPSPLPNAK